MFDGYLKESPYIIFFSYYAEMTNMILIKLNETQIYYDNHLVNIYVKGCTLITTQYSIPTLLFVFKTCTQ